MKLFIVLLVCAVVRGEDPEEQLKKQLRIAGSILKGGPLMLFKSARISKFSFKDLGGADSLIKVHKFSISPEKKVTATIELLTDIDENTQLELKAQVLNLPFVGTQTIRKNASICESIPKFEECPAKIKELGLRCQCPFSKGVYELKDIEIMPHFAQNRFALSDFIPKRFEASATMLIKKASAKIAQFRADFTLER